MLSGNYVGCGLRARRIGFRKSSFTAALIGAWLLGVNACVGAATISTYGGNPVPTGTATNVGIGAYGIAIDSAGDIYHADASNHAVHKINHTTGISTVIAGTGSSGSTGDGGAAISAKLNAPRGMTVDSAGNVYIADTNNHRIRKIDTSGNISTIAGIGLSGSTGDTGLATAARINFPQSVKLDSSGNLYIADTSNHRIRKVDTSGIITTVAGSGVAGSTGDSGAATTARLNNPRAIAFDSAGNMFIADTSNHRIRKVDTSGNISTYAGSTAGLSGDGGAAASAQFSGPQGLFIDGSDNIYVADTGNSRIRKIDSSGNISTYAGTSSGFSGDGGAATSAQLAAPVFAALDGSGNLYISDTSNSRLRKVNTTGDISTYAGTGVTNYGGDGGAATMAQFSTPQNVAVDSAGNVYMADSGHHRVRKIDTSGNISTYAGTGTAGLTGDGGPATSARINTPLGLAVDSAGNLYISEGNNSRIRKVDTSGTISTVAGTSAGFSGDGGAATSAQINSPFGVGVDSAGNIYIGDTGNQRIRMVDTSGNISTIGGTGSAGSGGDGGAATSAQINTPMQVVVNSSGEIFFVDYGNSRIRKIDTSGNMQAFAGTGVAGLSGDGGAATSAQLNSPRAVIVASDDTVYIADTSNSRIRHVDGSGNISTVAGTSSGYSGDGGDATIAQLSSPQGVAITSGGIIYIGDTSNRRIRRVLNATAPTATTDSASGITDTGATLNGTVNDNGATTTVTFDYGTNTGYGTNVGASTGGTVTAGTGSTAAAVDITGLTCHTTYHFRVNGTNSVGTTNGSDASFTTSLCPQTITFANPGTQNFGTSPTLTATSDSSLTVSFTSSTTGVCTITSGGTLTFLTTGTCTINADQAGNSTFAAATQVSRSFTVNAVAPSAPMAATAVGGDAQVSLSWVAPATDGAAAITGYSVSQSTDGMSYTAVAAGTCASSAPSSTSTSCTITGLTNGTVYTFKVAATNSVGTGVDSSASNEVTPSTYAFTADCNAGSGDARLVVNAYLRVGESAAVNTLNCVFAYTTVSGTDSISPSASGGAAAATYFFTKNDTSNLGALNLNVYQAGVYGFNYHFHPLTAPTATTDSASGISDTAATLNGQINDNGANTSIDFEYGTGTGYGSTASATPSSLSAGSGSSSADGSVVSTAVSAGVSGLTCHTLYHFRINGVNAEGTTHGADQTFTSGACAPDAPTGVTGLIGSTQLVLSWTAPASNGGAAITGYSVTQSSGGGYSAVASGTCASAAPTSTATTCSVTGLTNATTYTFKVAAINSTGTGSDSAASSGITPAPTNLTVAITRVGPLMLGTAGAAYTITVTNTGGFTDGSLVTVTDTLPAGLTATSVSGGGWVCDFATDPTVPTCTRSDVLLNGASYPDIALIADVDDNTPDPVTDETTNSAGVAGGGDSTPATNNNISVVHVYTNSFEDP